MNHGRTPRVTASDALCSPIFEKIRGTVPKAIHQCCGTVVVAMLWAFAGTACAPGHIAWPTGDDALRTALYRPRVDPSGIQVLTLVLSNGYFDCELPSDPDPVVQTQALLEITTAACRENARHVLVELYRGDGTDWAGVYPGDSHADRALIASSRPRLSNASYYGIDEAEMVSVDGFVRTYGVRPGDDVQLLDIGDGGEVEILDDGARLRGRFEFPDADISGSFRALECEPTATLFTLLEQSPVAGCPSIGG